MQCAQRGISAVYFHNLAEGEVVDLPQPGRQTWKTFEHNKSWLLPNDWIRSEGCAAGDQDPALRGGV